MAKKYEHRIKELESQGKFNDFAEPIESFNYDKIDNDFEYDKLNIFYRVFGWFVRCLIFIFIPPYLRIVNGLKIENRNNYKKVKNTTFISISNHTQVLDCGISRTALLSKRVYYTAAEINNKKGWRGKLLRSLGMVPISMNLSAQRKLDKYITALSKKNCVIQFYPEHGMWEEYTRIRPFNRGAFHFAVKNKLSILPEFVYYRDRKLNNPSRKITLRYLEPITAKEELNDRQNTLYMQDKAQWLFNQAYKDIYGKDDFIVDVSDPDLHFEKYLK